MNLVPFLTMIVVGGAVAASLSGALSWLMAFVAVEHLGFDIIRWSFFTVLIPAVGGFAGLVLGLAVTFLDAVAKAHWAGIAAVALVAILGISVLFDSSNMRFAERMLILLCWAVSLFAAERVLQTLAAKQR
jgi:hypothetical protein